MATSVAVNRIGETSRASIPNWEQELNGARMLLASGLLPDTIRKPEAALFIILVGRDLGLSAVQSLRSINVIKGKVEVAADQQLALFHRVEGCKSRWLENTPTNEKAVIELHAPWLVEPHVSRFTMEMARQAKLTGDNWIRYPAAMLRSRAITAGLKSIGFDPTAGVYAIGELGESLAQEPAVEEEEVPPVETELSDSAEPDDTVGDAAERDALAELEALMPSLAPNQQDWLRGKLFAGDNPVSLLEFIRERVSA